MARRLNITRRDFLNGVALGTVAGGSLAPLDVLKAAAGEAPYPPLLSGMRGSHPGSFEVAHAVSWAGTKFPQPDTLTDDEYDLVVVGGGISGLAAAFLYRQQAGRDKRILILDNHDDFGGHAKRNEFRVGDETLLCYGGSQSIDSPGHYSAVAKQLLVDIGIDVERFYDYFDQDFYSRRGLARGLYFSRDEYGRDETLPDFRSYYGSEPDFGSEVIQTYPISEATRQALLDFLADERDLLPGLSRDEKIDYLRKTSYRDYMFDKAGVPEEVYYLYRDGMRGLWGVGWDALSALEAWRYGMPGTQFLGIDTLDGETDEHDEPYIFHFPDGNAGVARLLVRQLIPDAVPGDSMEDVVPSRVDYDRLDRRGSKCRIRLNSTAVDVRHVSNRKAVDVTYVTAGKTHRVRGKHVVMACYNNIIPHICPELPAEQAEAIGYASKVPLVYISVAVRNWRAFAELGFNSISVPKPDLMHSFGLDFPVSMGGYEFADKPSEATVVHGTFVPTVPDQGHSAREQHTLGRRALYEMTWDRFESGIVAQMQGALGAGGFDAERDIAAITVNRWPHGYAYEYNELWDPVEYNPGFGPHLLGARQVGRISIANSDASAYAYVNGAIDAAHRAVKEQLS